MKTSDHGVAFIKSFEGLERTAYLDVADVPTIGYGHTETVAIDDVIAEKTITEQEAEDLLRRDLERRERALNGWAVMHGVDLNQNEYDALVSFIFNAGFSAFEGSTAAKRLKKGDRLGAADALTWWNKATVGGVLQPVAGLIRRRAAEKALFLTPVETAPESDIAHRESNARPEKQCGPGLGFRR